MYRRVKSQDTDSFILGCSEFFLFCFNLKKKRKKRKDGRKKTKTRKVYQHRAWKLIYILPKQLWSSPTLLTQMASLMKEEFMLKYEIQKGTHLHTAKYQLLALPICMVMYLVYHMLYNNNTFYKYGTTSDAKVAITQITSEMTNKTPNRIIPFCFSHLNIHKGLNECLWPELGNTFQSRRFGLKVT